jgi:hypothetical protein
MRTNRVALLSLGLVITVVGCGSSATTSKPATSPPPAAASTSLIATSTTFVPTATSTAAIVATATNAPTTTLALSTFTAEVWADNWFSLYANGTYVGEDSVPITTERSFNAETITFTGSYPLTIAMVTKDFKENDTGLEYIGTNRQQMGDAGFIAQITDTATGKVVAATNTTWRGLVIHQAPTNKECAKSPTPATVCKSIIGIEPAGWAAAGFDDAAWPTATAYTEAEVGTKDGYNTISWNPSAALIWSSDLVSDNTVLWRTTIR